VRFKKRKVIRENRAFNEDWTDMYMFILPTDSSKSLFEGKQKGEFCAKIKEIPISASSAAKKREI